MVVVVNRGADSGVVLVPLISLDLAIAVLVAEALEELQEDLILGHLTALHLGVHAAVVDTAEVGGGDLAITVGVELQEGLVDHSLAALVEGSLWNTSRNRLRGVHGVEVVDGRQSVRFKFKSDKSTYANADKELVEVDETVTVGVEKGHEGVSLLPADADLDLAEAAVELLTVDLVVAIEGVEVAESTAEATDGLSTAGLDLSANLLENYSKESGLSSTVRGRALEWGAAPEPAGRPARKPKSSTDGPPGKGWQVQRPSKPVTVTSPGFEFSNPQ